MRPLLPTFIPFFLAALVACSDATPAADDPDADAPASSGRDSGRAIDAGAREASEAAADGPTVNPDPLDPTFTNGTAFATWTSGMPCVDFGYRSDDTLNQIAIDANGRLVIAGTTRIGAATSGVVARLSPLGTRDPSFGANGTRGWSRHVVGSTSRPAPSRSARVTSRSTPRGTPLSTPMP